MRRRDRRHPTQGEPASPSCCCCCCCCLVLLLLARSCVRRSQAQQLLRRPTPPDDLTPCRSTAPPLLVVRPPPVCGGPQMRKLILLCLALALAASVGEPVYHVAVSSLSPHPVSASCVSCRLPVAESFTRPLLIAVRQLQPRSFTRSHTTPRTGLASSRRGLRPFTMSHGVAASSSPPPAHSAVPASPAQPLQHE